MSAAISIPGHDGRSSSPSDLRGSPSPTHSELAKSCPIPIPHGLPPSSAPASSSKNGDPESSRHVRLARKAESARAARLRHKQYVSEMHEQMMLLHARVRELERLGALTDEEGMRRALAQIKAALSPAQAAELSAWLKAAATAGGGARGGADLSAAFDGCTLHDALPPSAHASAAAELRALVHAGAAAGKAAALAHGGGGAGLATSLPAGLGLSGASVSPSASPRFGSVGYAGGMACAGMHHQPAAAAYGGALRDGPNGHPGGGPLRGRGAASGGCSAPIGIGGGMGSGAAHAGMGPLGIAHHAAGARNRASAARGSRGGGGGNGGGGGGGGGGADEGEMMMAFPMESDDDAQHGGAQHGGAQHGGAQHGGAQHGGAPGGGGGSFSARHGGPTLGARGAGAADGGGLVSRSWDDIESAQAILSLHGCTPPHANSYNVQSMDLQFQ
ncbi:hypothetical protein KFE25_011265 [Diacronema lutheri]|uniref:BZIP domain-containing protein n=2 Tax=Diacronema lutheri TaxID=2081491 RepID=A0A8J5X6W8_DIALT|nr:hypothetical protein KFE25_011265 [Diacronema lutheri]